MSPHFFEFSNLQGGPKPFPKRLKDTSQTDLQHGIVAKKLSDEDWIDFGAFQGSKNEHFAWKVLQKSNFQGEHCRGHLVSDLGRILKSKWTKKHTKNKDEMTRSDPGPPLGRPSGPPPGTAPRDVLGKGREGASLSATTSFFVQTSFDNCQ